LIPFQHKPEASLFYHREGHHSCILEDEQAGFFMQPAGLLEKLRILPQAVKKKF
jgi:hypothetical protein